MANRQESGTLQQHSESTADLGLVTAAAELLHALGAPHRLAIVLELADGPRCVHELVERLGISQSLTSQHLRVLRNTGLAVGTRRGKETVYSLADEHVAHIARDALAHSTEPISATPPPHPHIIQTTETEDPEETEEEHQPS
jgi:DNA-binding transcriptional ArsR family regulator